MIDWATRDMLPALKRIWMTCFGDSADYTTFIFDRLLRPENILTYTDGEHEPVAMLCVAPFTLVSPMEETAGAYVYGVATLPGQQGRGLSTALLSELHLRLGQQGAALSALVPAGEKLFGFYGKRGYETAFQVKKATFAAGEIAAAARPCVLAPATLEQLAEKRDSIYAGRELFVRWDTQYLRYIGEECEMLGGEVLTVSGAGGEGYAVCYRMGETVIIKELALPTGMLQDALAALHARFGAKGYTVYLPADTPMDAANRVLPFAMVQWYDKKKQTRFRKGTGSAAYIAHVLD